MSKSLNIGLVGSGFMGQAHADAYRRARILYRDLAAKPELYAIADQNAALAEEARARFGFENAYGDWRQLVEDPKIDLVDITTPNFLHVEVALAALEAGKHVYCEKPMAVTVEGARRMAAVAKKAGVKTMVAFNNIKTPAALLAKQIIERGEIGQPVRFRGTFDQGFFNDPSLPWSWRCSRELAGSGALGLEALSRGARYAVFIEESPAARAAIRRNVEALGLTGVTKIRRRDATKLGEAGMLQPFQLIFCDPPYGKGLGERALEEAIDGRWAEQGAIAVLEERIDVAIHWPPSFREIDRRRYGDTQIAIARLGNESDFCP